MGVESILGLLHCSRAVETNKLIVLMKAFVKLLLQMAHKYEGDKQAAYGMEFMFFFLFFLASQTIRFLGMIS
jgi:hypothetical protein